jgi:hypothetical protein
VQKALGDLIITLVTSLVESDKDFIGEAAAVARGRGGDFD